MTPKPQSLEQRAEEYASKYPWKLPRLGGYIAGAKAERQRISESLEAKWWQFSDSRIKEALQIIFETDKPEREGEK